MSRLPLFLFGACIVIAALTAERLIAPFYGSGPFLDSSTLTVALLAAVVGGAWSARRVAGALSGGPAGWRAAATGPSPMLPAVAAGIWLVIEPWLRSPLLGAAERAGLTIATLVGLVAFVGIPLGLLAAALVATAGGALLASPGAGPRLPAPWPALIGAALASPLVTWALLPALGVTRTLIATGALAVIGGWLAGSGRGRASIVAALVLTAAGISAWRFAPGHGPTGLQGLVAARDGRGVDYRVVDRTDGRFLIADGGIQTLISSDTGDPLMRPTAVFHIVNVYVPPESMVVLGLSGGAAARRFAREGWRVSAVEPDPDELAISERAMHFSANEVPVTVADPRTWCRRSTGRWPVVLVDAYERGAVPAHLLTREFVAALRPRLTANGLVALSLPSAGWNDPLIAAAGATLRTGFRNVLALPTSEPPNTPGSVVLLASDRDLALPDARLPQPTDFFMNLEEHWGVVQMNHAWFNHFVPDARGGIVLSDDRNPIDALANRTLRATRADLHANFGSARKSW